MRLDAQCRINTYTACRTNTYKGKGGVYENRTLTSKPINHKRKRSQAIKRN